MNPVTTHEIAYEAEVGAQHDAAPRGTTTSAAARRALDVTVSAALLIVLSPLLVAIAVAIRLDSRGPALFRQRRLGRGTRPFTVVKFRTMRATADSGPHRAYVQQLIESGHEAEKHGVSGLFKLAVDDRVTRVGRFLRKTSLDELPQLLNVVRGDMSLVGPRPVIPYEYELYPKWYGRRFLVKPGMTGLWQVNGRSQRTYEEMVRFDIEYVERQSLRLDLTILIKTAWVLILRRGAA